VSYIKTVNHISAGGFLFFNDNKKTYIALLKNRHKKWVIPHGHVEKNENIENAAVREIKEELGIDKKIKLIGKIGTKHYDFYTSTPKIKNHKIVHLFTLKTDKKVKLKLNKKDGSKVKWFDTSDALKRISFYKKELLLANNIYINFLKAKKNKIFVDKMVKDLNKNLKTNLFAIISSGSVNKKNFVEGWSDIDVIIVVRKLRFFEKKKISVILTKLSKMYNIKIGIDVITREEFENPLLPWLTLPGKVLFTLTILKKRPENLLYGKITKRYVPNKKTIMKYSLYNIWMLLFNLRKRIASEKIDKKSIRNLVTKEIRIAFIVTKLALQYLTQESYENYEEILENAKREFKDFNFSTLEKNIAFIKKWNSLRYEDLIKIAKETDLYLEKFVIYFLNKVSNHPKL
jgi:8-oxo-dGTP pyrophosphatase MutT (NUDIX family)